MKIICDTHIPIFFQDAPNHLSTLARQTFEQGIDDGQLALADISLWEIAMLFDRGRLNPQAETTPSDYISDLIVGYGLAILLVSVEIAITTQSARFSHGDPADRLIAATAMVQQVPLLTKDKKLIAIPDLKTIW